MVNGTFFLIRLLTSASTFRIFDEVAFYSLVMIIVLRLYVASLEEDHVDIDYLICLEIINEKKPIEYVSIANLISTKGYYL
jgi:hypothetical protein